jgi:RNA recognition motif-containing protein
MRDQYTNRPRGFGFVHFTSTDSADRALEVQHTINGKVVEVKRAQPRDRKDGNQSSNNPPDESQLKVFVGGVGQGLTEEDLKEFFTKYGNVLRVHIMTDKETGRPRGFAFVDYDNTASVEQALKFPDITVKDKPLQVKPAVARQTNKHSHSGHQGFGRSGYSSRNGGGPTRHRSSNYGRSSGSYSQYPPSSYGSSYGSSSGSRYPYSTPTSRHTPHMNPAVPSYGSYYPEYSTDPSAGYAPSAYSYTAPVPTASSYPPPPRQTPYVPPSGSSAYGSALGAPDDRYRYPSAAPPYGSAPRYPNPPVGGSQPMSSSYGRPPQSSGGHSRSSYGSSRGRSHHGGYHPYSR